MIPPSEALARLREGNLRFVNGECRADAAAGAGRRAELVGGQSPWAVVLGCADSRVPPETVFDQGLGELFTLRVAGNIVTQPQLGSIEFAVENLDTRLVVVLGHSGCGAVTAALAARGYAAAGLSSNLRAVTDPIVAALAGLPAVPADGDRADLLARAVRQNIHASVAQLGERSRLLARRIRDGELMVMGAEYALASGKVEFFADGS